MSNEIIPLTERRIPTILSMDSSLGYIIGDEARISGIKGITNVFSFKERIGLSDAEYAKGNQYFIAPGGETRNSKTFSAKEATELYLQVLLAKLDETPESWIVGQPSSTDKIWLESYRRHIREAFLKLGHKPVDFWPEPFAVFQYYCSTIDDFKKPGKEEFILVIDVGGGTFNSSIIHTTESGDLGRGGAKRVPYGLQSEFVGGHIIDEAILDLVVLKAKKKGVKFKDPSYLERIRSKSPGVLLVVEEAKISLSKHFHDDHLDVSHEMPISFEAGLLHESEEITETISCLELKEIVAKCWQREWFPIIDKTIREATKNHNVTIEKIDRVLIAGGSSQLPDMKLQVFKCLSTRVEPDQIYIGENSEVAVATGIALECMERSKKDPELAVNQLANCMTNNLYFGLRPTRRDDYEKVSVSRAGAKSGDGQLLASPMEAKDLHLTFRVNCPFQIGDKLLFGFAKQPLKAYDQVTLNPSADIVSIPKGSSHLKKYFDLELTVRKDGRITPKFTFHSKSRKNPKIDVKASDFYFDDLEVQEGSTYIGVDFGNSNSYVTKYINIENDFSIAEYPNFTVSKKSRAKLLQLEKIIQELRASGKLTSEQSIESLESKRLALIYHSNKIEGNKLSFGETKSIVSGEEVNVDDTSKLEVQNLEDAYLFVAENYESIFNSPGQFIRELHRIVTEGILDSAGEYRARSVEISGADFVPPQAPLVPPLMDELFSEIRTKGEGRSPIEYVASIHTAFTMIHPFEDGNGRTARALVAALLIDFGLPQIVLKIDDRTRYMVSLGDSNKGDISSTADLLGDLIGSELKLLLDRSKGAQKQVKKPVDVAPTTLDFSGIDSVVEIGGNTVLDFTNFDNVLEAREIEARTEIDYKLWIASIDSFYIAFQEVCNQINQTYTDKALRIDINKFDDLSFETYYAFQQGEPLVPTWFFSISIEWLRKMTVRFSFIPKPDDIEVVDGGICLLISTPDELQDDLEPISATSQKYVLVKDKNAMFFPESENRNVPIEQSILDFLAEVLRAHEPSDKRRAG